MSGRLIKRTLRDNSEGQLGDGTSTDSDAPAAVSGGLTFQSVSAGWDRSCGVTLAGTAYCWGDRVGTNVSSSVPALVDQSGIGAGSSISRLNAQQTLEQLGVLAEQRAAQTEVAEFNETSMALLGAYETGDLLLRTFGDHGWRADVPFFGKLGIIAASRSGDTVEIIIGTYRVTISQAIEQVAREQSLSVSFMLLLSDDFTVEATNIRGSGNVQSIARLTFEGGVLSSKVME